MSDKEMHYETFDMPYYKKVINPLLPREILDFHTHAWKSDQLIESKEINLNSERNSSSIGTRAGSQYMTTKLDYSIEQLLLDGDRIFFGKIYSAVCFGQPTPTADTGLTNDYIAKHSGNSRIFPLRVTKKDGVPADKLYEEISEGGFFGYKVFLDWVGNDYKNITVENMIGHQEMSLANELSLVVLLHVPGSRRLADPNIQKSICALSQRYPCANIVLAHCGRCYLPGEMLDAINGIRNLENVYLDTSMVMDVTVLEIVLNNIDSKRLLFGTDFPVAAMRGKRVYVMDHWVDIVLDGYPESEFRVGTAEINASYMAYEIILAIYRASQMVSLPTQKYSDIFFNNGMDILKRVMNGKQFDKHIRF